MRTYCILIFLIVSSIAIGQKLTIEVGSPFTAVKWEANAPIVQFENEWYQFEALDHFSKKEILDYCKRHYGRKWKDRFSEDLIEVLNGLGYQPNIDVSLQLTKDGMLNTYVGTFTAENRSNCLAYNNALEAFEATKIIAQNISKEKAIADINEFEELLNTTSSYAQLSTFDYTSALHELVKSTEKSRVNIDVNELANELSKIMSEIGDRHSSIKNEGFKKEKHSTYNLKLPFGVAVLDGNLVALKQNLHDQNYSYYYDSHPYIKSIDGKTSEMLLNDFNYRDKKAPLPTKLSRGAAVIQNYGALLFKNNKICPESVRVVFTNRSTDKEVTLQLTKDRKGYISKLLLENFNNRTSIENGDFKSFSKKFKNDIGYITIPKMSNYNKDNKLEEFLETTLEGFTDTKALIIDIRNNPGGGREILQTFAKYIVQPQESPWVANVAYLRTDYITYSPTSMNGRFLYRYDSEKFTDKDRKTIDKFNVNFKLQKKFQTSKFSEPFYMVLNSGNNTYKKPVYILVNEYSFSAATVFTSAFKGLKNVYIVGETTDGSSGNSNVFHLRNSNIRVRISTMLSFQRNGTSLDGNGTIPDIKISVDEKQMLEGKDRQLVKLIKIINDTEKQKKI